MKIKLIFLWVLFCVFGFYGMAKADLTVIGTATYGDVDYNLIYEEAQKLVWLDYSNPDNDWDKQMLWATNIGDHLVVTLDPLYVTDTDWKTGWRLPTTIDGTLFSNEDDEFYDGTPGRGYNKPGEMGHLYYVSLGNLGYYDTDGVFQSDYGLKNTGPFNYLEDWLYFSSTEYSIDTDYAWWFDFNSGYQRPWPKVSEGGPIQGLAVRSADIQVVPEPSTVLLLASGLAGLGLYAHRRRSKS